MRASSPEFPSESTASPGLEARYSALPGLNSHHLSHIVPVFSFTLGLKKKKTKVKEKGKAGSGRFRPSPGWAWPWPWGTQAELTSLGGKQTSSTPVPTLVLEAWLGWGPGGAPRGEAPGCRRAVAFWPSQPLSGRRPVRQVP